MSAGAILSLCLLLLAVAPNRSWGQPAPSDMQVATVLVGEVHTLVTDLAAQRDALGGWPAAVSGAYSQLQQLESQLETARAAGDARMFRRGYRAAMRVSARISRWLSNQYDASNEQVPSRERADAIAARLSSRVNTLSQLGSQAGVTLNLSAVNAARAQFESVRASGTNAELRATLRALRDAVDSLQDAIPDPEN